MPLHASLRFVCEEETDPIVRLHNWPSNVSFLVGESGLGLMLRHALDDKIAKSRVETKEQASLQAPSKPSALQGTGAARLSTAQEGHLGDQWNDQHVRPPVASTSAM